MVVLAIVAASAFASAAGLRAQPAAAQAGRDAAVPFKVGERLTYDVTWSTFLVAGAAYATVRIPCFQTRPGQEYRAVWFVKCRPSHPLTHYQ
jgi:hypothetical protein